MKKLLKMVAVALAFVFVISITGIVDASAATATPKLNYKSKGLYVGGSTVSKTKGTVLLKVTNRPKKYSVEWESSDPTIATVEKYKGVSKYRGLVTAVSAGTCTITAKVIDKTTTPNTLYTLTCKMTIKKNCSSIELSPVEKDEITEGDTLQLTGTMYDANHKVVTTNKEVTDTIKWATSDSSVATVSNTGLVKAIKPGTATIYCYSVQSTSGSYSAIGRATAKTAITITVKTKEIPIITEARQQSLKTAVVKFGQDYSKIITKDNLKVTKPDAAGKATDVEISSIEFDASGTSATLTFKSELTNSTVYTVSTTATGSTLGLSTTFTSTNGVPVAISLYTGISGRRVIAGDYAEIYFTLVDGNGVDITPAVGSVAYENYAANFSCERIDSEQISCSVNGRNVWIYDAGKTISIVGKYDDKKGNRFSSSMAVTSVTEASTMTLAGVTIAKSGVSPATIDWSAPVSQISLSDTSGYKIVARVMKSDGTYIYSDDSNTKITFEYIPTCFFLSGGVITPLSKGTGSVNIKYDGVTIGTQAFIIGVERTPVKVEVYVDGVKAPSTVMSDRGGITNPVISLKVIDNYGDVVENVTTSNFTVSCNDASGPYAYASSANSDGAINLDIYTQGYGLISGKSYTYTVKYVNGTTTLQGVFNIMLYKPNESLPSTYKAVVTGDTDMKVANASDLNKAVTISFVEYKGDIRYDNVSLRTSRGAAYEGEYYITLKDSAGNDVPFTVNAYGQVSFKTVTTTSTTINKVATGEYKYVIYKKTSTTDTPVQGGSFTITDSQTGARFELVKNTTTYTLRATMSQAEKDMIFSECFYVYYGDQYASATVKDVVTIDGAIFFKTVDVVGSVTIEGTTYSLSYTIPVNVAITTKK